MSEAPTRRRGVRLRLSPGTYRWCSEHCGVVPSAPLCVEEGCGASVSVAFTLDEVRELRVCTCGATEHPPFCDGAHHRG